MSSHWSGVATSPHLAPVSSTIEATRSRGFTAHPPLVTERVRALATETAKKFGVTVEVEPVQALASAPPTAPEAPVVKALAQAIRQVYGRSAIPQGIGGGTVAAFFRKAGLPAAVWMTANDCAHQPNEFCFLSHLLGDAKVLAHVCLLAE